MEDDSANFVKYFTDPAILKEIDASAEPESRREAISKEVNSSLEKPETGLPPILSGADFPPLGS